MNDDSRHLLCIVVGFIKVIMISLFCYNKKYKMKWYPRGYRIFYFKEFLIYIKEIFFVSIASQFGSSLEQKMKNIILREI